MALVPIKKKEVVEDEIEKRKNALASGQATYYENKKVNEEVVEEEPDLSKNLDKEDIVALAQFHLAKANYLLEYYKSIE